MAKLSFCIPIETESENPLYLASALLAKDDLDLEVIVVSRQNAPIPNELLALSNQNQRLRILEALPSSVSDADLWAHAVQTASGDWITVVRSDDMIERELTLVADYLERNSPQIDALAWNVLQIDTTAEKDVRQSVAIPIEYAISAFDKNVMLQSFFAWENSRATPTMPFGLFHGMIKKSLVETVLATMSASGRKTCLPHYEWAARVVLLANDLAFAARPMSVQNVTTYQVPAIVTRSSDIPFDASLGITGGIAEIQHALLKEMGSIWAGSEEAFVRACIIDCMIELEPDAFAAKAQAYFEALSQWQGGRYVPLFQPEFVTERPKDIRRGLHGNALMIDRFIGGATTPQDFYRIVRSFLAPIRLICGGATA